MRHLPALLLAASLLSPAAARGEGPAAPAPAQGAQARPALEVTIDRSKVDIKGRQIEVKLSRAASKVRIKVLGQSGAVLAEEEKPFGGAAAGTPLVVTWSPASDETVARIEVYGHDTEGYWAGIAILPWNVSIPHEEVQFETNSDVIRAPEVPKLEASLKRISEVAERARELGKITLFIVGHTDTVGSAEHNLALSRRRARSIAAWFKGRGLKLPVAYEGLGESSPIVKTADQVDEPRNRRVDYILSIEPPKLPSGEASWKSL
ncbi:OmpA family protein [Sorangium sp. So ce1335]|uniref:OmpA family protein n=1 Tax=Sorangium sp. So ce1335 TaxID=3133335 RepID=UPI003F5E5050